jgi:hypothetical protein
MAEDATAQDIASTWDKLENWKRWLLAAELITGTVLLALAVCLFAILLVWQGKAELGIDLFKYVLTAMIGLIGAVVGYYFGSHQVEST